MAKTLQFRRGTTSELSTQTGAVGELFVDTTKDTVVVMDGSTAGGFPLQRELLSGTTIKTINGQSVLGSGDITISGGGSSFSGSYNDLSDKPFIPNLISQLMNDAGFITSSSLASKQDVLYSGINIKTINGQSVLGSGNITISGSGSADFSQVAEDIVPLFSEVYDVGSTDKRWYDGYFSNKIDIAGGTILGNESGIVIPQSALIGGVSIVDNTISATGVYGNAETLTVDGDLNVTGSIINDSVLTLNQDGSKSIVVDKTIYVTETIGSSGANFGFQNSPSEFYWSSSATAPFDISKFVSGTTVTINSFGSTVVLQLTSNLAFSLATNRYVSSCIIISNPNNFNIIETSNPIIINYPSNGIASYDFTGTGFNADLAEIGDLSVTGALTVNGLPVVSYDQDLNTTSDVAFNSTLVGNVSIIGNTIGAIDSYGNSDTLVVDSNLNVQILDNVLTETFLNYDPNYGSPGAFSHYPWDARLQVNNTLGQNTSLINSIIANSTTGSRINFKLNTPSFGLVEGYAELSGIDNFGSVFYLLFNPQSVVYTSGYNLFYWNISLNVGSSITQETTVELTPLSVTESGVAVSGALTVNGQQITPPITYDQDLNTTNDVVFNNAVFNSALVGDVSIVGNQIATTDAYGNPDTLVLNSNVQVSFGGETVYTGTDATNNILLNLYGHDVSFFVQSGTFNESFVRALYNNDPDSTPTVTVTLNGNGYGDFVLRGRLRSASSVWGQGSWGSFNNPAAISTIYFDTAYINEITVNGNPVTNIGGWNSTLTWGNQVTFISGTPQVIPLSVTETGINVEGSFTVNGAPVGGSSFDQDLNTTDDVVFNSALVGDVSIVGNTISGIDSYGNANTLVVDGDLTVANIERVVNSYDSNNGLAWGALFADEYSGGIRIESYGAMNAFTQNLLSSIPTGTRVSIQGSTGLITYTVTGLTLIPGMGGDSYIFSVAEPIVYQGPYNVFIAIETSSTTNVLSVTETGVNVDVLSATNSIKVADETGTTPATTTIFSNGVTVGYLGNSIIGFNQFTTLNGTSNYLGRSEVISGTTNYAKIDNISIAADTTTMSALADRLLTSHLNGDVAIYEITLTAVATNSTGFDGWKSWKFRYASNTVNNTTAIIQIGTTEVLDSNGDMSGVSAQLNAFNNSVILMMTGSTAKDLTWAGDVKIITNHRLVPVSGGGGK